MLQAIHAHAYKQYLHAIIPVYYGIHGGKNNKKRYIVPRFGHGKIFTQYKHRRHANNIPYGPQFALGARYEHKPHRKKLQYVFPAEKTERSCANPNKLIH